MRLVLIGGYTPANLGDGAITLAMIDEARRVFGSDVDIQLSAADPAAFETLLGITSYDRLIPWQPMGDWESRLRWLVHHGVIMLRIWLATLGGRRALSRAASSSAIPAHTRALLTAIRDADLVLAAGGGYLSDAYRLQFPFWFLEWACVRAAGVPLGFFSQSFGPAKTGVSRYFLKKALRMAALFIARDDISRRNLQDFGADMTRVLVCPDVALLTARVTPMDHGAPTLGVSLLKWQNYASDSETCHGLYMDQAERALREWLAVDATRRIRLLPTNTAFGRNRMDDVAVSEEMLARLARAGLGGRASLADWTADPASFCADVAGCQLLLASRMHSAVLALSQGVPVAGIAYEDKMFGLLGFFGLDRDVVDIDKPEGISEMLEAAWEARWNASALISQRLPGIQREASCAMEACSRLTARSSARDL